MNWEIQVRPGGRGRKAEVVVLGEGGVVLLTDTGRLASIEGRQETAARLAVSAEYIEAKLDTAWNAFVSEKLRDEAAEPPAASSPDPADLLAAMPARARDEGRALLAAPDLMDRVLEDTSLLGVAGEEELV